MEKHRNADCSPLKTKGFVGHPRRFPDGAWPDAGFNGHVVDFLLFHWRDWYFPAFNLADVAITCGAALLILDEILRARRARPS